MGFPVGGEEFLHVRVKSVAVIRTCLLRHADSAVRLQGTLEGRVRLNAYDSFFGFIKISGTMGRNGGNDLGIHIQDTAGFSFFAAQIQYLLPKIQSILGRACEKSFIPVIRVVIVLDEITHVDFMFPIAANKTIPFCSQDFPPFRCRGSISCR